MSKPHSRKKRVGTGSVNVGTGRKVSGRRVGGTSQMGRDSFSGGGFSGGGSRSSGSGGLSLGSLLAIFAVFSLLPKKARKVILIVAAVALLLYFVGGSFMGGSSYQPSGSSSGYTPLGQSASLFDSEGLYEGGDLFGAGSAYSGGSPQGTSQMSTGGLLQPLTSEPINTSNEVTVSPANSSVMPEARDKFVTPIGGGKDVVTIMVYMCGTDLESNYGMATSDLSEMVKADLGDNVNLIVLTGGCKNWKNSVVSSSVNQIYRVHKGGLERLESDFGNKSMVEPDTLSEFIRYCGKNYEANRNVLIFWDHGGGSISGFGYDQKHGSSASMTLNEIDQALSDGGIVFDWIGFDACLMATLETAMVCADHADYLVASEEVEPGTGWYYTNWLGEISSNTSMPTLELTKGLVDDYVKACRGKAGSSQITLSVTDLAELQGAVPTVFRDFSVSTNKLISGEGYKQVANARAGVRQFSQSSKINQVDLVDLALRIGTDEANKLAEALKSCVKYNGTTMSRAYGLSIYFPYESLTSVSTAVNTYKTIGFESEYSTCIKSFASLGYGAQVSSSASQGGYGSSYGSWEDVFGSYGSSGSGGYGDLLDALMGSYTGSASPSGSLSGSYFNSYGSQSAGYSLSPEDLTGLLSAFSGRSMPQNYEWVDTELIAASAEKIAANYVDPGRITASLKNGQPVLSLTEEEWSCIETVELNLFAEADGYVDLGLDNVFEFEGNDLLLEHDGTWLCVDGQIAAYYLVSDTLNPDGSWTTIGRIPALLNGQFMNLQVVFDKDNPYGVISGAYPLYENGQTQTQAKGCIPIQVGDSIEFLCDFYGYDGSFESSCTLGSGLTVESTDFYLENLRLNASNIISSFRITDIYGNVYWLEF